MKLYVVGQFSGKPSEWDDVGDYALVLAESPEQAKELTAETGPAIEVDMSEPCRIANVRGWDLDNDRD